MPSLLQLRTALHDATDTIMAGGSYGVPRRLLEIDDIVDTTRTGVRMAGGKMTHHSHKEQSDTLVWVVVLCVAVACLVALVVI